MKIAIVGAGLIGRLSAIKLILAGHDITVLEGHSFDHPHNTVAISAGLMSPISEIIHTSREVVNLGFESAPLWPKFIENLQELDPEHKPIFYSDSGTIALSFPEHQNLLIEHNKILHKAFPENKTDIQMLHNDEVEKLEPELGRYETVVHIKNEANICNRQFLQSTSRAIRAHANIIDFWPLQGDGSDLQKQYDWIIDSRGAGAIKCPSHAVTDSHKLTAIRGEIIRVHAENVNLTRPVRIIQKRSHVYVVPKPNNDFVVGSATDIGQNAIKAVTVRSSLDLLSSLFALHPGFADAEIIEAIAGHRAVFDDKLPSVNTFENIVCVNGLNRHGWMVGPAMVDRLIAQMT